MKKIKSFIYLDNYKMYSISSQLFEGLTEHIVKSESKRESEKDEQQGERGSGRIMADIIESESQHSEKRFLHHYSYNLFEDELLKQNRVLTINSENIEASVKEISDYTFVKITNNIAFNDTKLIVDTFSQFNEIGEALTYIQNQDSINQHDTDIKARINNTRDRNEKSKIKNLANNHQLATKMAKEAGLYLDEKFLESLTRIVNYGYNSSFEAQIPFTTEANYYLFSSLLDRSLLAENELSIIKKYSRETEKEFTIFGMLTQVKTIKEKVSLYAQAIDNTKYGLDTNMKEAIFRVVTSLTNIEQQFVGKLDYEYVVDPIAIYREF